VAGEREIPTPDERRDTLGQDLTGRLDRLRELWRRQTAPLALQGLQGAVRRYFASQLGPGGTPDGTPPPTTPESPASRSASTPSEAGAPALPPPDPGEAAGPGGPDDRTQALPIESLAPAAPPLPTRLLRSLDLGEAPPGPPWYAPLVEAWNDPQRRQPLVIGAVTQALLLAMMLAAPWLNEHLGLGVAPAEAPPAPAEGEEAPAPPPSLLRQLMTAEVALKALPLLLGLFWLLSAWLVDAEARRAFVVQEPWGERRTVAYSCLAVGCVFPLILAGLIFTAYGFVAFVIFVAERQSWSAGIQAGGLILLVGAFALLVRSLVARWYAARQ
jgi:hypothetical protein